ncbi:phosphoglycerate mutase-like protein [Marasmius fiardii PR-910]|nr:phosphoglycerate mutase-like protein [Marasmius fiardii PR-910]
MTDTPGGHDDEERETLLPTHIKQEYDSETEQSTTTSSRLTRRSFSLLHITGAFAGGVLACILAQYAICGRTCISSYSNALEVTGSQQEAAVAPPWVGSTTVHHFPPTSPTNAFPSLFPTDVGYPGGTPTGGEAAVIATAPSYPIHTGAAQLVVPESLGPHKHNHEFDLFKSWGNLSPWYSIKKGLFGVDSGPEIPDTCRVTGLHFLHRHGARYPTAWASYGGPSGLANRLNQAASNWTASGDLNFLNEWTYKLGEELLTPFGRQQLYDLGISLRLKYGFLLQNFTDTNTIPVFRTESQDRMLHSALNFALGFFGYPFEGQYQQSITIEAHGFNNTLAPYDTCPNARRNSVADRGTWYVKRWAEKYLKSAQKRLQAQLSGYELTIQDVFTMQQMCAYETVAIGYSKFCELFTQEEWEGFDYSLDLSFWYNSAFGSPVARVQGAGWIQEMIHRLERRPITEEDNKFSMNFTLDGDIRTFPVNQSLYVDATHEVVVLNIITALNLTSFAQDGPLPYDHILKNRKFRVSRLAPFATNVQFQLLSCDSQPGPQIRVIINDGVAPLSGIEGCPSNNDGMCPVETFARAQKKLLDMVDWDWACHGEWEVAEGPKWETITGDPPAKDTV